MKESGNKKQVLFVCIGNMIRSQMAEGFARNGGSAFVEAHSAGVSHTGVVSEEAVTVMTEKGIDLKGQYSKGLSDVPLAEMDYIINMSGYSNESVFPAALRGTVLTWPIKDPLGGSLEGYRRTRDVIESKVDDLLRRIWQEAPNHKGE